MGKRKYEEKLGIIPLRTSMAENPNLLLIFFSLRRDFIATRLSHSLSVGCVHAGVKEKGEENEGRGKGMERGEIG